MLPSSNLFDVTSCPALFGVTNKSQKRYIGSILTGVVRFSFPFVGSPRGHAFIVMAVLTFYPTYTGYMSTSTRLCP